MRTIIWILGNAGLDAWQHPLPSYLFGSVFVFALFYDIINMLCSIMEARR